MKRVHLDFAHRDAPTPRWCVVMFVLGAIAAGAGLWRYSEAQLRGERAVVDLERVRVSLHQTRPVPVSRSEAVSPAAALAMNRAIGLLNLPWPNILATLERARPAQIALLSLDPEPARRVLRVTAEARRGEEMLAFVEALRAESGLADVSLAKHETRNEDGRPLRFVVEARWKDPQ